MWICETLARWGRNASKIGSVVVFLDDDRVVLVLSHREDNQVSIYIEILPFQLSQEI